ncbi:MAG: carboxysome shell carbonic anhydrase [Ferrovum sp. 37-45-19]|nr:MAG: carboxysome shell carbonic anhydrase [Ferrovum sp. 21-44-67]OYV94396.1 MAG: carboxysome shell carbonic anhydrase [Ferrovum sp. 37-45-19]HQT80661.1 carboxysome shell carbonic anhydrase [Ferrovaceae bacterium]HQU05872.1 carboxysome shell carbonic anhydrase [Ferrovaceae bacterium]
MNTRNRPGQRISPLHITTRPPYGLGTPAGVLQARAQRQVFSAHELLHDSDVSGNPACSTDSGRPCRHPLTNESENLQLLAHELKIKNSFDAIVQVLKRIASLQHEPDFEQRAQAIALEQMGFELPADILADAWVSDLDMRVLYGESVMRMLRLLAAQARHNNPQQDTDEAMSFFLDSGYHAVDISPCSDGRLKGLVRYILRLPDGAVHSRKSYAGAMFDVEANVKRWIETELMRFREGRPVTADAGTRYLKVAVYHWSSSNPKQEGCAAHGSNAADAAEAALQRLNEFRQAIENSFCCGASVDSLLIGVDTDTDAIKVHIPDADGQMSLYRFVDNIDLYRATVNDDASTARLKLHRAILEASAITGWGAGNGEPHEGMRRLIASLLINNLSQIEYVCSNWGGRYKDIGHAERFINVGEGFEEFQMRNLAYLAHLHTIEEGAPDMDVGIKIFKKLNIKHGLPIPIAIHYRYDSRVPGCRERSADRCKRIREAIEKRYFDLAEKGLLVFSLTVQDKRSGSPIELVEAIAA